MVYENGDLVSRKLDKNLDGRFEHQIVYNQSGQLFVERIDLDLDGRFDTERRALQKGDKVEISTYRLDGEKARFIEKRFEPMLLTKAGDCVLEREDTLSYFQDFAEIFQQVAYEARDDFSNIGNSLSIHKSCYKKFDEKKFNRLSSNAVSRGMSCLSEVARQKISASNRVEVFNLLDQFKAHYENAAQTTQMACGDKSLDWSTGAVAYGSRAGKSYGEHKLDHPFVILSPNYKSSFWGGIKESDSSVEEHYLEGIIFHEMIHNMGYTHGDGFDMSYACESCCFGKKQFNKKDLSVNAEASACRLCAGDYVSEIDPNYLYDLALMEADSDTIALLNLLAAKRGKIDWGDKPLMGIVAYFEKSNPSLSKALHELLEKDAPEGELKRRWQKRMSGIGAGPEQARVFNKALASLVKAFFIDNDEEASLNALSELNLSELRASAPSGTLGMGRQREINRNISSFRRVARIIEFYSRKPELKSKLKELLK